MQNGAGVMPALFFLRGAFCVKFRDRANVCIAERTAKDDRELRARVRVESGEIKINLRRQSWDGVFCFG